MDFNVSHAQPDFFYVGLAVTAAALYRIGGLRAVMWIPFGALVIKFGPEALKTSGEWQMHGMSMRFIPSYLITIAGAGALLYGFVEAYAVDRSPTPAASKHRLREFAVAGD